MHLRLSRVSGGLLLGMGLGEGCENVCGAKAGFRYRVAREDTPISLSALACSGNLEAKTIWENGGYALGIGITNVMNLLNPESIVLTGGLVNAKEHFLPFAEKSWKKNSFEQASNSSKVSLGQLGQWAGVRGAIHPFL